MPWNSCPTAEGWTVMRVGDGAGGAAMTGRETAASMAALTARASKTIHPVGRASGFTSCPFTDRRDIRASGIDVASTASLEHAPAKGVRFFGGGSVPMGVHALACSCEAGQSLHHKLGRFRKQALPAPG